MANYPSVPYDNDPRPLQPANRRLRAVREEEGPNPTQDGPRDGTAAAGDDPFAYLDTSGPEYAYLGHFRGEQNLEEGHNTSDGAVSKKISHLVHEGKPQKQAVAMALSMKRAGRLTKSGGYRRVGK
jgi:hypothetical protein